MKIQFDATVFQYPLTGVAKSTLALYEACLKRDPSLELVALHQRALSGPLCEGIRVLRRGSALPAALWRKLVLPMSARGERPDLIHFPWNGNIPSLAPIPVVMTLHDVLPLVIPGYFKNQRAERQYRERVQQDIDRCQRVVTVSEFSKNEILKLFRVAREPAVIPNAPVLRPAAEEQREAFFLYVGGYDRRKGIEQLLSVFCELRRAGKIGGPLILTGSREYYSPEFKQSVEAAVRAGFAEERGYVSDEVLAQLLGRARALVYPSKYEGFGLPPLDAMNLGCPVITTRGTALPEVCGDAALYVDPDDERDFAEALVKIDSDAGLRAKLSAAGRKQAARFSWDRSAEKFLALVASRCAKG
jgi:alpha-1,3-rhamnosyl/mannosyltransferase